MRAKSKLLALALTAALQPAIAAVAPISLNFEEITWPADADGVLSLHGPIYTGVEFKDASWAVSSTACDGIVNFVARNTGECNAFLLASNMLKPLPSPVTDQTAKINVTGGFITGSYLYYSALRDSGVTITAYTGLDGTGTPLDFDLNILGGCAGSPGFCNWTKLDLDLGSFTARSLVITGIDNSVMLDDLFFVAPDATQPPGLLPEPGSIALTLGALGALGWNRKRKTR